MERYLSSGPAVTATIGKTSRTSARLRDGRNDVHARRGSQRGSRLEQCPLCGRSFHVALITSHAAACTGPSPPPPTTTTSTTTLEVVRPGASEPCTASATTTGAPSSTPVPPGAPSVDSKANKRQQNITTALFLGRSAPAPASPRIKLAQLEHPILPGQHLIPNFITEPEEEELLAFLDCTTTQPPWKPSTVRDCMCHACAAAAPTTRSRATFSHMLCLLSSSGSAVCCG